MFQIMDQLPVKIIWAHSPDYRSASNLDYRILQAVPNYGSAASQNYMSAQAGPDYRNKQYNDYSTTDTNMNTTATKPSITSNTTITSSTDISQISSSYDYYYYGNYGGWEILLCSSCWTGWPYSINIQIERINYFHIFPLSYCTYLLNKWIINAHFKVSFLLSQRIRSIYIIPRIWQSSAELSKWGVSSFFLQNETSGFC